MANFFIGLGVGLVAGMVIAYIIGAIASKKGRK